MNIPPKFKPIIANVYPPCNRIEFERWLDEYFHCCNTDRIYLPIYWTGYYVNNNYGNDKEALQALQVFLDDLPRDKKYWTCVQYDDGILNNVDGLDLLQFNMSKNVGVPLPLICQHGEVKKEKVKYMASFIGSITHPIRQKMINALSDKEGYYISTKPHTYDEYSRVMAQSMFTLAPRGYGANSFRCYEAIYQGSIPIYIAEEGEHIIPFGVDFDDFGLLVNESEVNSLDKIICNINPKHIVKRQENLPLYHELYFSYEGCLNKIIQSLELECNSRKSNREVA